MPTINGRACVVNGTPVDKVFSNDRQVYGRNLLTGTSNDIKSATGGDWLITTIGQFNGEPGKQYTTGVNIDKLDNTVSFQAWTSDVNGKREKFISAVSCSTAGKSTMTFIAPTNEDYSTILLQLAWTNGDVSGSYAWRQAKAEKGSVATPWTPAPEDVGAVVQSA